MGKLDYMAREHGAGWDVMGEIKRALDPRRPYEPRQDGARSMAADGPEGFARAFSAAWLARDVAALAGLFTEDADFLTLTGDWAEGRQAIARTLTGELKGAFARTRLVTGRSKVRLLGPGAAVVHQRFVLTGVLNADGSDAGRVATILMAVLIRSSAGWQAVSAQFTVEES